MKKYSKKIITLLTSSVILSALTMQNVSYANTDKVFEMEFPKETIFENLNLSYKKTNDVIYPNNANITQIYMLPNDLSHIKSLNLTFSSRLNRIGVLNEDWSIVEFQGKQMYIKNSDISTKKGYNTISYTSDNVIVSSENNFAKLYSKLDNLDNFCKIENNTNLHRILSLDNGYSLVEYEDINYFIKTSELVKKNHLGKFQITYYCACNICNGGYGAVDYFGNPLKDGTAAVDTSVISFGTNFLIQENGFLRECVAKDIGGAIKGNHIDVFVDVPHSVCEQMGNSYKDVYTFERCN